MTILTYETLHKIGDIWLEIPKIGKSGIWDFGDAGVHAQTAKIQFWEAVISLIKFFTKTVISGSKFPKSENLEFVISAMLEFTLRRLKSSFGKVSFPLLSSSQNRGYLARNTPNRQIWNLGFRGCWSLVQTVKIQFWEGVISLYKFFMRSVISRFRLRPFQVNLPRTERCKNTLVGVYFLGWANGPYSPRLGSHVCLAGNDCSILDHVVSAARNHTNDAQNYRSVLLRLWKAIN